MFMIKQLFKPHPPQPIPLPEPSPPLSRQELINQISELDWEAREACIDFLQEQYPTISRQQVETLLTFIFENNFKIRLPNHFGGDYDGRSTFGYPYIWLLNELETGGIQYLYQNSIWQIHWDVSDRQPGWVWSLVQWLGHAILGLTPPPVTKERRLNISLEPVDAFPIGQEEEQRTTP